MGLGGGEGLGLGGGEGLGWGAGGGDGGEAGVAQREVPLEMTYMRGQLLHLFQQVMATLTAGAQRPREVAPALKQVVEVAMLRAV